MKRAPFIGQAFTLVFSILCLQAYCQISHTSQYTAVSLSKKPTNSTLALPSNSSTVENAIQTVYVPAGSVNTTSNSFKNAIQRVRAKGQTATSASPKQPSKFKWFGHYILAKLAGKFNE